MSENNIIYIFMHNSKNAYKKIFHEIQKCNNLKSCRIWMIYKENDMDFYFIYIFYFLSPLTLLSTLNFFVGNCME